MNALFNGGIKTANALKTKISEDKIRVQGKYQPSRTISFVHRFMAATDNDHVAQIERDDRRFFVCQLSDDYMQNTEYFASLYKALGDGVTVSAFVQVLENRDLSDSQIRHRPKTS